MVFFFIVLNLIVDFPILIWNLLVGLFIFIIGKLLKVRSLRVYGRNQMLTLDQYVATKVFGQDPDVSISGMLGLALEAHNRGEPVAKFWILFGIFVNWLFWNPLIKIEKDHIQNNIDRKESHSNALWTFYKPSK